MSQALRLALEQIADDRDRIGRLEAECERLATALGAIMTFTQVPHPAPCGTDACLLCLIEGTAKGALRLAPSGSGGEDRPHGTQT